MSNSNSNPYFKSNDAQRLFENNNNSGFYWNINNYNKFSFFNDNYHISNNGRMLWNIFNNNIKEEVLGYNNNNCWFFKIKIQMEDNMKIIIPTITLFNFNNHDNENNNDNNLLEDEKNIIAIS